jgi:hypothetical protein
MAAVNASPMSRSTVELLSNVCENIERESCNFKQTDPRRKTLLPDLILVFMCRAEVENLGGRRPL